MLLLLLFLMLLILLFVFESRRTEEIENKRTNMYIYIDVVPR